MPPDVALRIVDRFGCGILQGDGTTECGSSVLSLPDAPIELIAESPGPPTDVGNEVKVVDPKTRRIEGAAKDATKAAIARALAEREQQAGSSSKEANGNECAVEIVLKASVETGDHATGTVLVTVPVVSGEPNNAP